MGVFCFIFTSKVCFYEKARFRLTFGSLTISSSFNGGCPYPKIDANIGVRKVKELSFVKLPEIQ